MPIWLRKYTFNTLNEHYKEQAERNKQKQPSTNKIQRPAINPSYTSKASK